MGETCSTYGEDKKIYAAQAGNSESKNQLGDLVDENNGFFKDRTIDSI